MRSNIREALTADVERSPRTSGRCCYRPCGNAADAPIIVELKRAAYEKEPLASVKLTEADILRDGFGPQRRFESLLVEVGSRAAGFALFFHNYSTCEGRAGIYVEDIFVSEWARGRNVGRRLLAEVAVIAEARGFRRVDLSVLHWNPARAVYERIGLVEMSEWRAYRLKGKALASLAAEARPEGARGS